MKYLFIACLLLSCQNEPPIRDAPIINGWRETGEDGIRYVDLHDGTRCYRRVSHNAAFSCVARQQVTTDQPATGNGP